MFFLPPPSRGINLFLPPPSRGRIEVGVLSYFSPSPLPSPIKGEGERRTSVEGEGDKGSPPREREIREVYLGRGR